MNEHLDDAPPALSPRGDWHVTDECEHDWIVRCGPVEQRNWSRVAEAAVTEGPAADPRVFVKQFVDRNGSAHPRHWLFEMQGVRVARSVLADRLHIPELLASNQHLLLHAFEFVPCVTVDELLRRDPDRLARRTALLLAKLTGLLDVLARGPTPADREGLHVKDRHHGGRSTALCFKGLDIRNVGFAVDAAGNPGHDLVLFDFGRPYLAPIEEAAAKLFISLGLLNWGRPVRRFARGADAELLQQAYAALAPYLDRDVLLAELRLQESFRTRETQGRGRLERWLKRAGIDLLGRKYVHQVRSWCAAHVP